MRALLALLLLSAMAGPLAAQSMPRMDTPASSAPLQDMASTGILGAYPMTRDSSGTSWQPDDSMHSAVHGMAGDWMLMGHMMLWGIYDTQSGPRGADKTFLEGMLMGAARRDLANGDTVNLRAC